MSLVGTENTLIAWLTPLLVCTYWGLNCEPPGTRCKSSSRTGSSSRGTRCGSCGSSGANCRPGAPGTSPMEALRDRSPSQWNIPRTNRHTTHRHCPAYRVSPKHLSVFVPLGASRRRQTMPLHPIDPRHLPRFPRGMRIPTAPPWANRNALAQVVVDSACREIHTFLRHRHKCRSSSPIPPAGHPLRNGWDYCPSTLATVPASPPSDLTKSLV
jgi:hypothetical protein